MCEVKSLLMTKETFLHVDGHFSRESIFRGQAGHTQAVPLFSLHNWDGLTFFESF